MATPAKRSTQSSKSKSTAAKSVKSKAKVSSLKSSVNNAKQAQLEFWQRSKFLFFVALIAAALIAVTVGLMSYSYDKGAENTVRATGNSGVMFLQTPDSDGSRTAGDVVEVVLFEDSGKNEVNALQGAVRYPADKLELIAVKNGSSFTEEAATDTETPGLVRVARSIKPGAPSIKGAKPVVTIQFKVLQDTTTPIEVSVDETASLLVRSTDNQNILQSSGDNKYEL